VEESVDEGKEGIVGLNGFEVGAHKTGRHGLKRRQLNCQNMLSQGCHVGLAFVTVLYSRQDAIQILLRHFFVQHIRTAPPRQQIKQIPPKMLNQ